MSAKEVMIEMNEFLASPSHLTINRLELKQNFNNFNNNSIKRQKRYTSSNSGATQCEGINLFI